MYNVMKKLIEKKFYRTAAEARERIDIFFAVGRLDGESYTELAALCAAVYGV